VRGVESSASDDAAMPAATSTAISPSSSAERDPQRAALASAGACDGVVVVAAHDIE
jgi:hypothetical protein